MADAADWPSLIIELAKSTKSDWVALSQGSEQLTIRELAERMQKTAAALRDGSGPVMISTPDALLHTTAVLGAGAAGRPALMVDSRVPDQLALEIYRRTRATALIGRDLPGLIALSERELNERLPIQPVGRSGDAINTMLLTSGSTGVPKVVQRSISADFAASHNLQILGYPLGEGDRYLLMVPFASAVFITILMGVIILRSTVVIGAFGEDLGQRFADQHISGAYCVPTMLRLAQLHDGLQGPGWDGLRGLMVGGEQLDAESRERLAKYFPDAYLFYGMSEHPNVALARPQDLLERPGCVGLPLPMRDLRFVHPGTQDDVEQSKEGQILLRGPELFSGYVGEEPIGDWFATGDIGYRDKDGFLYVTGRVNDQVNVGGNRVSTVEVSALIDAHPEVLSCAVVAIDDPVWTTKLIAFVVRAEGAELLADDLVSWLKSRTTAYRIPRAIYFLDRLPVDTSGKLSRQTLVKWAIEAEKCSM
ncbi:class I adenylate-forming enzyme family protein [Aquisediminimonas profunda]|uniref:class I adenylate-forming enzyme family protein n=1 Tax=Aquisediminimonas profunda TaxID=1550733 RepID=UPI001C63AD0C|nr:fatty acid--CoA ligase family protein [Aquisediminimonas profunda]